MLNDDIKLISKSNFHDWLIKSFKLLLSPVLQMWGFAAFQTEYLWVSDLWWDYFFLHVCTYKFYIINGAIFSETL